MVARPGPISLPLVAGQNQKVDPRIQSPQEFASVLNIRQTRDGRQHIRGGFEMDDVGGVAGSTSDIVTPIRCVGDGDLFVADSGETPPYTYAYLASVRSRARVGPSDTGTATAKMISVGTGGIPSLIPERVVPVSSYKGEREQTSANADISNYAEWIATANLDSGAIVVTWRSKDSLETVASYRVQPSGYGSPTDVTNYVQCVVVCSDGLSDSRYATVVIGVRLDGAVYFIRFDDAGSAPVITDSTYTVPMNVNDNGNIDAVAQPGEPNFALIYSSGAATIVKSIRFQLPHSLNWSTTVYGFWHQYQMQSIDTNPDGDELLWAIASTDPLAATREVRCGTLMWNTGAAVATSALLTLGAGIIPGIPMATHADQTDTPSHYIAFTTMTNGVPEALVYAWPGANTSTMNLAITYPNGVVAGRPMLNADDGQSNVPSYRRLVLPMMQSGYSFLDTDLAYDDLRPVFLMSLISTSSPCEAGIYAINGEAGQATHPMISPLYSGSAGYTLGAPPKMRRITSNSGTEDTPLTGAYFFTFDVAVPGKSRRFNGGQWRIPLQGLPRQGRLAIFKPMLARQCELEPVRAQETIIPGLTPHVCDGISTHSCGFLEAPVIRDIVPTASTFSPPGAGDYTITAVYEWTDASGRRYQSAPAVPRETTLTAGQQAVISFALPVAGYSGMSIAIYRTPAGGSEFKRDGSLDMVAVFTTTTTFQLTDDQLIRQETLYTSLGEVPNDPPPSAQRFARTRDRVWAYGLDRREVVQSSKLLKDAVGICWSNSPNYFVVLPEDVVAVETLDETAVVFTADAIYTIGGSGPDDTGIGTFVEPGRIPGYVGCVSPRSVISADAGIYFQSQRGIELLPRGFGSSQWVGQPVMGDLETYSLCNGVTSHPDDDLIVWCMVNPENWDERLFVYDARATTWSVWEVPQNEIDGVDDPGARKPTCGLSMGGANPVRTAGVDTKNRLRLWSDHSSGVRIQAAHLDGDYYFNGLTNEVLGFAGTFTTGWLRFAGTSGWQIIRRLSILCTPRLADWRVVLSMYFNDVESTTEELWVTDWTNSTQSGTYELGDSLTLEVQLPVVQFESIKLVLSVTYNESFSFSGPNVDVHSVMLYPEAEGARLRPVRRR